MRPRPSRDLPPLRRFGQNFLVDAAAIRRIRDAVASMGGEVLLEIGPGRGALTESLLETGLPLVVVEIDRGLAARLRERFSSRGVVVLEQDVLDLDPARVTEWVGLPASARLVVAGNLPYNVSKPIALRVVEMRDRIAGAVLTFQREVADRLVAEPGTKAYGPLTVLVSLCYRVDALFHLPPGSFRPMPTVTSTVTRWTPHPGDPLDAETERAIRPVLRACFARRRGTLRANLRAAIGDERAVAILEETRLDGGVRAERLTPGDFVRLTHAWPST